MSGLKLLGLGAGMLLLTSADRRIHSGAVMADTANTFLAALEPDQRAKAAFKFEDDERYFWHYVPSDDIPKRYGRPRRGLPLREMSHGQRHLAHALLSAGLSQRGYIKAATIMSLEEVLRDLEKDSGERRNAEKYYFSIFGQPAERGTWGYRVEGHHLSLHFTVVNGTVVATPAFLGSNPAEVRSGPRKGLRALGREEDLARDLMNSLDEAQRKIAVVSEKAYPDILTAANRTAALEGQPDGLEASRMSAPQRARLEALLEEYVNNLPEDLARVRLGKIRAAGQKLRFAWAGVMERGGPHYYRIQSPTFLVEYDNTQNGANHVHTVWRELTGDWGADLLKEHYRTSGPGHGHTHRFLK
jgi:hypothetical protein